MYGCQQVRFQVQKYIYGPFSHFFHTLTLQPLLLDNSASTNVFTLITLTHQSVGNRVDLTGYSIASSPHEILPPLST